MDRSLEDNSRVCWCNLYHHLRKQISHSIDEEGLAGTSKYNRTYMEMINVREIIMQKYVPQDSQELHVI